MDNHNNECHIGKIPFDREVILSALAEFIEIYSQRPILDNSGGMKFNHCFATWFIAKQLSPKFIIESGVWKGQSTWLLEKACPSAQIFCLDLNFSNLKYKSKSAKYIQNDFSNIDWSNIVPSQTLCFFDDHQNAYHRLKEANWIGIKDIIFEDNYSVGQGDVYSLRKMLAGSGHTEIILPKKYARNPIFRMKKFILTYAINNFFKSNQHILVLPNTSDKKNFLTKIEFYYEFPPVYLEKQGTLKPLVDSISEIDKLKDVFDSDHYCHIAYVKIQ